MYQTKIVENIKFFWRVFFFPFRQCCVRVLWLRTFNNTNVVGSSTSCAGAAKTVVGDTANLNISEYIVAIITVKLLL